MKKFGLLSSSAMGSAALFGASLVFAAPAYAQDDQATPPADAQAAPATDQTEDGQNVEVTGTRIRRPNLDSAVPVTSISGQEFFERGQTNVGDTLNELPQLRTTFGQQNAGRFLGTTGLNLLDLRGLGSQRTLVLVNGRRHVPSDILNNGVSPDVNTIPNDLIERVDIVTGGNSAIYGSDAIAGVVNFILRRDYEGLQIRGQAGIPGYGAGGNQYGAVMWGTNFGDGRGNITLHAEYAHQDRLYGSDIPFLRRVDGFVAIDSDTGANPNGSDGFPDRVFMRDIRGANINVNTQIAFTQRDPDGNGPLQAPCGAGFNGTPYNCVFFFDATGTSLVQQTGQRVATGPIGSFIGGNGPTNREGILLTVLPRQDRYNTNLLFHYTFSDAFEVFAEAKYVRVDTRGQNASPAFTQGGTFGDPFQRERVRLDNPFLQADERAQITNLLLTYNCNPGLSNATCTALTPTQLTNIANGSFRLPIQRQFLDLGLRDESSRRETYRGVVGLRGTFNDDWTYEISANYGRVEEATTVLGNIDLQRLLLAMDAGIDPANPGAGIQCRSRYDPASRGDYIGDPVKLAADIAACTPYNPFGRGDANSAARQYIVRDTTSHATLDQLVLSAFMSGDSSSWFELPGGPVRFAFGLEYRRERLFYQADPFIEQGLSFYNALPTFNPDPFDVKEAYAEIQIPLLSDTPFFENLSISGAARVASYGGGTGTVWAYNAGIEWAPIRDIRFRANYGRSVRAPNLTETSFPLSQNFAPGFTDPCNVTPRTANPTRAANCLADVGANLANLGDIAQSLEIQSGSNPDLQAETSDSWTFGAILQPRFIPGLSLTVDYYNIKVAQVIGSLSAQAIVNNCYDLAAGNQYCDLFQRNTGPGAGPNGEAPGRILEGTLLQIPLNFAALKRRGIDFELAYRRSLGDNVTFNGRVIWSHQLQNSNFTNPLVPGFENRIMSELGDPQDEFQVNADLTVGPVTFGYRMRYIGKQVVNLYEDLFPLASACTTLSCPPNDLDWADRQFYPSVLYHDFRLNIEVARDYSFYAGVDNAFDRAPPLGTTGTGAGSGIYSIRGRSFYAGFRARF
jgi:outer membrane receptor protein involved in Fe transport